MQVLSGRPARLLAGLSFLSLITAACSPDVTEPPLATARMPVQLPAVSHGGGLRGEYRRIAERVPGFGGFYYDSAGNPVALLQDARYAPQAAAALSGLLHRRRYIGRDHRPAGTQLVVRSATYSYVQLTDYYRETVAAVVGTPGLVESGIDDGGNQIFVGVRDASARAAVQTRLAATAVPRAAVRLDIVEPPVQMLGTVATVRDTFAAVPGGVRIMAHEPETGHVLACSTAFNLGDSSDPGVRWFATAAHCTGIMGHVNATQPTLFWQPEDNPNNFPDTTYLIGHEEYDAPWRAGVSDFSYYWGAGSQCPAGLLCKAAEIAWVRYKPGAQTWDFGGIARPASKVPGTLDPTAWDAYGPYIGLDPAHSTFRIAYVDRFAVQGETIDKVGASSGWSSGTVTKACFDVYWNSNLLLCSQEVTGAHVAGGDSGGAVFRNHGDGTVDLLGVLWGGADGVPTGAQPNFTFSPWDGILMEQPPHSGWGVVCDPSFGAYCF